ncbi:MAG: polysaccharide biosynthesis/export family protein [Cytophagaceae bacterium]|jgi:polysaccharide export outer membrane protein|nr:polysaccharide biosynthesis/export family protein [Cytophagaceae bacterium]
MRNLLSVSVLLVLFAQCVSTKKTVYFHGMEDKSIATTMVVEAPVIQKNDLLDISISSLNPNASAIFNLGGSAALTNTLSGTITQTFGYLVDQTGAIQLPVLGNIKAEGLTQAALKDSIVQRILQRKLLIDPIVTIRFLNFKISVMGEVGRPNVYNIPNEKITLLEALTLAGDLTVYSRRDNVLLIREEKGQRQVIRINLNTDELFTSPYYYLKSGDILYVEHNRAKVANSRPVAPWLSAIFSGSSLIIVILDRLVFR